MKTSSTASSRIYRLDKFLLPSRARGAFLSRVKQTHSLLQTQPGFIRDTLLEKPATDEEFIVVTLVEWQDRESLEKARDLVESEHRREGFNRQEFMAELGVEAEIGTFTDVRP
jgi:heme-degrading monooxygenase HmoA